MKVIIDARALATNYEKRGVGYHIKGLMRGLPRLAPDIRFIFFLGKESSRFYLPDAPNVQSVILKRTWRSAWLEDGIKLPGEIRKTGGDLFHCPVVLGPLRSINIPYFSPVPVLSTIHDLHVETLDDPNMIAYRKEWRYKIQRRAVKKTRIITVSQYTRNLLEAAKIAPKKNITVIPNCVKGVAPDTPKENIILFIGDASHKNTSAAVEVFKTLAQRLPDWKFIMVGSRERIYSLAGKRAKELQATNILQIADNVVDEVFDAIFSKSRILFMPSLSEGFGVPILQAFANKTCVAISDRGALPEIGGNAAVYINPDDSHEMVSTLEGLTKNVNLQKLLIEKGMDRLQKFLWEKHLKALINLYRKTIKENR